MLARIVVILFLTSVVLGCEKIDLLENRLQQTPHEAYSEALNKAGLSETELGRRWFSAAESVLKDSLYVQLPYEEVGWLAPEEVQASAWKFSARKGQRLTVELETPPENRGTIFVDLFVAESEDNIDHIASLEGGKQSLDHIVQDDAEYVLRLQPELLAGGRYELRITLSPSLTFPVEGKNYSAIGSVFGDPRDGGSREHHGVDIFAPRGTKVLAAANGVIYRTGITSRGGKVVWLMDRELGQSYYYAHLDEITVREGVYVRAGDPLGSVGNTGNARFMPPHLHFGIYESFTGPVDPFPFIYDPGEVLEQTQVAHGELQSTLTVTADRLRLREGPSTKASILTDLKRHTILRAVAKTGNWYRVTLPNSQGGYVSVRYVDVADNPFDEIQLSNPRPVLAKPTESSPEIGKIPAGNRVKLYGQIGGFRYVKLPSGQFGWIDLNRS
jgi:murein DD-endopeptidase MepM/ murein hydrolase activator NlpD